MTSQLAPFDELRANGGLRPALWTVVTHSEVEASHGCRDKPAMRKPWRGWTPTVTDPTWH